MLSRYGDPPLSLLLPLSESNRLQIFMSLLQISTLQEFKPLCGNIIKNKLSLHNCLIIDSEEYEVDVWEFGIEHALLEFSVFQVISID